ncbi:MAG: hypothetical protein Fur0044_37640 [Anaerolineae bacterium]
MTSDEYPGGTVAADEGEATAIELLIRPVVVRIHRKMIVLIVGKINNRSLLDNIMPPKYRDFNKRRR